MCSGCVSVSVSVYRSSCKTRSKRQHTSTQPNTKHQMAKIRIASFAQEECSSLFFFLSFLIIIFCFAAMKHTWREDVSWTSDKALAKSGKHDLREVKCKTNKAIMWMIFFPRNLNELDRMHLVPSPKKIACTRNKRINRFSSSRRECCECKCCTVKKLHGFTDRSQLMGNLFIWLEIDIPIQNSQFSLAKCVLVDLVKFWPDSRSEQWMIQFMGNEVKLKWFDWLSNFPVERKWFVARFWFKMKPLTCKRNEIWRDLDCDSYWLPNSHSFIGSENQIAPKKAKKTLILWKISTNW